MLVAHHDDRLARLTIDGLAAEGDLIVGHGTIVGGGAS